jgi:hypothetical protein
MDVAFFNFLLIFAEFKLALFLIFLKWNFLLIL